MKIQIFGLKNSIRITAKQIWLSGHLVQNFKISIHVIPPSSSGRLQEMSHKIGKNSFKKYHFLTKIQNLPEMNREFSYIFYTFFKNLPEMEEKSP